MQGDHVLMCRLLRVLTAALTGRHPQTTPHPATPAQSRRRPAVGQTTPATATGTSGPGEGSSLVEFLLAYRDGHVARALMPVDAAGRIASAMRHPSARAADTLPVTIVRAPDQEVDA